jgi:Domain of unknown function (DUF4258)
VRLTRHAKDRARQLQVTLADVERLIEEPIRVARDEAGRPKYYGKVQNVIVCIVVALDDPDLIVTIYDRRRL